MKKLLMTLIVALMTSTCVNAQILDKRLFNHLTVGLNVGTTGIGADVAMPATRWLELEAGFSIMPKIKYSTNLHLNMSTTDIDPSLTSIDNVPIQGKLNMVNGKFMINFLPFPSVTNFHVTVGAYFGKSSIVEVYNTQDGQLTPVNEANQKIIDNDLPYDPIGLKLGDYLLTPDANGNAKASLKTNGFKPYVGIGFGRAVPRNKFLSFKFDLGAMFWGTPEVIDHNGQNLANQNWDGKDGGAFRVISKIKVYPVLNFRLCGKIF
ncbi:MAG: hypothetical protein IKO73_02265 [Bacteroidaceae bacterium]|nr:hypothetical protein [Bacteroidaceae bacterium]